MGEPNNSKKVIMVVEDEQIVALHIRKNLEAQGYLVHHVASTGEEAVETALETHPDLILMDIRLIGEMDGIEAATKIRESLDIPIIYLSAYTDEKTLIRAKQTAAYGYLIKPFVERELYSSVEIAFSKHQMEQKVKQSETSHRTLAQNLPGIVYRVMLRENNKMIFFNDMLKEITGYDEEMLHKDNIFNIEPLIFKEDFATAKTKMEKAIQTNRPYELEYRIRHANGSIKYVSERGRPAYGPDKKPMCLDGMIFDITEQKKNEADIVSVRAQLEHLMVFVPVVVYSCKIEKEFFIPTFINSNIINILGFQPEDVIGNPDWWSGQIHTGDRERVLQQLETGMKEGDFYEHEYRFRKSDDTFLWIHDKLNILRDEAGNATEIVGSWSDITKRKNAEQEVRYLSEITDNMSEGVMLAHQEDLVITYANKKFEKMFGYKTGELVGKNITVLNALSEKTSEETIETVNDVVRSLQEKGGWKGEVKNITKDGELFWSEASVTPFKHDKYGTIWITVQRDITHKKQLEDKIIHNLKALSRSNEFWIETFDTISDPLFIHNKQFEIVKANRAYRDVAGLSFKQIVGKKYWEVFPILDGPSIGCQHVVNTDQSDEEEIKDDSSGSVFRVRYYPIEEPEKKDPSYLHILEDVTELKNTQEMLVQSAKLASLGELAANVAHEINNPMTAILGFVSYVTGEIGKESPYYEDLKAVEGESLRVREIVRNLLDFAKPKKLTKAVSDINETLSESLHLIKHMAELSQIKIVTRLSENLPQVKFDVNQIKQVFINLVYNACQAMDGGGTLQINTGTQKDFILISFKDTGVGIASADIPNIFDPFFTTKDKKGTGLGLSISYAIIENHKGEISVTSTVGKGSEFVVKLPYK
ncbi:MAG: PAS domain S-box protein [Leptospirales bacterium]